MPTDVMCCEAEAGAATPKVRPCRTPDTHRTAVALHKVAHYCARARARQTCVLTRGRRSSANLCVAFLKALLLAIACGLSALWARAGVCCGPIGPGAKPCPKSRLGSCGGRGARRVRSARKWVAAARRLVSMSRPSFGGAGALRGGDHEHQQGRHHLRQEAHVLVPRAPAYARIIFP